MKMRSKTGCAAGGSRDLHFNFAVGFFFICCRTDIVGMDPALTGLPFFVGKLRDGVNDPIMGVLSDRTRSRWGRKRVCVLFGAPPLAVSSMLLWTIPASACSATRRNEPSGWRSTFWSRRSRPPPEPADPPVRQAPPAVRRQHRLGHGPRRDQQVGGHDCPEGGAAEEEGPGLALGLGAVVIQACRVTRGVFETIRGDLDTGAAAATPGRAR